MKNQALFSSKDKKLKCCLLQFLFGTLRVKVYFSPFWPGRGSVGHLTYKSEVLGSIPSLATYFCFCFR